jgi:hypothetical protein
MLSRNPKREPKTEKLKRELELLHFNDPYETNGIVLES